MLRFTRLPDPAAGVRAYQVTRLGTPIGTVTNRPGGWWRAFDLTGAIVSSSFCHTRGEAARALQPAAAPAQQVNVLVPGQHRDSCDRPGCTGCAPIHLTRTTTPTATCAAEHVHVSAYEATRCDRQAAAVPSSYAL